jgi:signal transduction histidine kinase
LSDADHQALLAALGETLANVRHAYGPRGGPVIVAWRDEGDRVRIEVEDGGSGVLPFAEGGGLRLMRAHADSVDARRGAHGGTVVSIAKKKGDTNE